jgi:hypothetical protein
VNEQEDFLSPAHKRLLDIAIWAKHLAWIVLVVYIFLAALVVVQDQINFQRMQSAFGTSQSLYQGYWDAVREKPIYYLIDVGSDMVSTAFKGIIYYVILKGISLGLYMIVETDINYREIEQGDQQ